MTIKQRQNLLAYLGYYTGAIDGIWGTGSHTAAKSFQKDFGITADGVVREETEKALKHAIAYGMPEKQTNGDFWDEIEYFKRSEFKCTCNGKYCNGFPVEPDEKLVRTLDQIRKHFGKPVKINSGIRCTKRNADNDVKGASNSQHLYGMAADIKITGVSPKTVSAYAETLLPNTGGIGIYSWGVHVDTRKTKSRWNG